jgi:hypothetical protein
MRDGGSEVAVAYEGHKLTIRSILNFTLTFDIRDAISNPKSA